MLKNWSLQGWTTVSLYYQEVEKNSDKSLHLIQNAAARVLVKINKRDHSTLTLASSVH